MNGERGFFLQPCFSLLFIFPSNIRRRRKIFPPPTINQTDIPSTARPHGTPLVLIAIRIRITVLKIRAGIVQGRGFKGDTYASDAAEGPVIGIVEAGAFGVGLIA